MGVGQLRWLKPFLNFWFRLHWRALHGPLPVWLQIKRLVQLVSLQLFLWTGGESPIQVAQGEALQWRSSLPQAGSQEPGEQRSKANRNLCVVF